jgi:hypothetical protein
MKGLATGEIDLNGAEVIEVASPPNGLKVMMEALEYSRVHNAMGSAGVTRRALMEAVAWASQRKAFGKQLIEHPMVQDELLDLAVRCEGAVALAFEAARAFDDSLRDHTHSAWLRLCTSLAKYRTAEEGVQSAKSALEVVGGNGYTEEFPTARQFRDSMVLTVWEGPANIQALELARAVLGRTPGDEIFLRRVESVLATIPEFLAKERDLLDSEIRELRNAIKYLRENPNDRERYARKLMNKMADLLTGSLLLEEATYDLNTHRDTRKALIARAFMLKTFGSRSLIFSPQKESSNLVFSKILNYDIISPEDVLT